MGQSTDCPIALERKTGSLPGYGAKRHNGGAQVCRNTANLTSRIKADAKKPLIYGKSTHGRIGEMRVIPSFAPKGRNSAIRRCFLLFGAKDVAYTALERSDNARVRKFAPCANLTNLKEAIVSKKENITNSERTGKKDNVSDTVNFAPIERGLHRQSSFNWSERREHTRHWSEATMRGCASLRRAQT